MSGKKRSLSSVMDVTNPPPSKKQRLDHHRVNENNDSNNSNNRMKFVRIKCSDCDKECTMDAEAYDAKSDTENWVFLTDEDTEDYDLLCMECYENDTSSNEGWLIRDLLKECEMIKELDVPSVIIKRIEDFGFGFIVKCVFCDKEDHMNCDAFAARKDTKTWHFGANYGWDPDDDQMYCDKCFEEHLCTFCYEHITELGKCERCDEVACEHCEDRHNDEHIDREMSPPGGWSAYYGGDDGFYEDFFY